MGIQKQIIKPQVCKDCPFFEIRHSSVGVAFFCRYYKKGAFDLKDQKFDFCHVVQIDIRESRSEKHTKNNFL